MQKALKKIVKTTLVLALATTHLATPASILANDNLYTKLSSMETVASESAVSQSNDLQAETVELAIAALYRYGRLDEHGFPTFDQVPFYVFAEFGHALIDDLIQTARRFDELILNGEIAFNEDLTIANDYLQTVPFNNRNRDDFVSTLFTNRFYMSRITTRNTIRDFRDFAIASGAGATMSMLIPGLGKPAAAIFVVNGTSAQLKANRLQDRLDDSTSFGTILVLHGVTLNVTFTTHVQ